MSYDFYRVLHVVGIILLFTSLGTVAAIGAAGDHRLRKLAVAAHGVAVAILLIAGFGLLAKLKMFGAFPVWVWFKLGIWLLLALAVVPLRRKPEWSAVLWLVMPVLGAVAAWLAVIKPF